MILDEKEVLMSQNVTGLRAVFTKQLEELCNINSGTYNFDGINKNKEIIKNLFKPLDADITEIEANNNITIDDGGSEKNISPPSLIKISKRPQAKYRALLTGHIDTVFSTDHPFQKGTYLDDDIYNAPGSADMKGGILVILHSLLMAEKYYDMTDFGFEIILNTDEEIGSPGSRDILFEHAKWAHFACVYEPSMPDGTLAGARKGSGNYDIVINGKAAHAGRDHKDGRNAIIHAAQIANDLANLTDYEKENTVNVAKIDGGGPKNMVPAKAIIRLNIRSKTMENAQELQESIEKIVAKYSNDDFKINLYGGMTRPPKEMNNIHKPFYEKVREIGKLINQDIRWKDTGGVCDGNNIAQAGIPVIDTLGVIGGNIHTGDEYIDFSKVEERILLSALIFTQASKGNLNNS